MEMTMAEGRPLQGEGRQDKEMRVYSLLDSLGMKYARVDHPAAETMEACREIDKILAPAVVCKNLFLCIGQKTKFYGTYQQLQTFLWASGIHGGISGYHSRLSQRIGTDE